MLKEYIKLLESFKQNKISKILERIDAKIVEMLYSKHISPRLIPYFPRYQLSLMSDETQLEPGTVYVRAYQGKVAYSVITPNGQTLKDVVLEELDAPSPFTLKALQPNILSAIARKGSIQWAPFTDYSLDPDNISQIKKLINSLYYARLSFIDLENIDVRQAQRRFTDLKLLYTNTISSAYEASFLLTHLDVDLRDLFHEELEIILPLFHQVQQFAENHVEEQHAITEALQLQPLAYKTGEITGTTIDQMRPLDGDIDYNFLTQFSAVLPSYIDQLTQYVQKFSSQIKESEPTLNQKKLDELHDAALQLLNNLESLKGSSVFVSLKFLNYIHIIRNIITLSMSSLEQIGELSESSQDLVRDKLAQIKYTLIPTLFGLVDKIETNAMLKPGTLSVPLMEKVKALYAAILYLPKKVVDFNTKGEELLEIEDPRFIELRLDMSYKRINKANKALYKIEKAHNACEQFFARINEPRYQGYRLYQFPSEIKQELIKNYRLISPYLSKLDIDLNAEIIEQLHSESEQESWSSYFGRPWRWASKQLPADHISFVLAKQKELEDLITKDENSQLFQIRLNKDLIESVHKNTNLILVPYCEREQVAIFDESLPLLMESEHHKKNKLTKAEFQRLQNAYVRFAQSVKQQIATNPDLEKNLALDKVNDRLKREYRDLYQIIKPYLCSFVPPQFQETAKTLERYLTALFANDTHLSPPTTSFFLHLDTTIEDFFEKIHYEWSNTTEFQKIREAYTSFSQRIRKKIEDNPEFYGTNLLLNHLDEREIEEYRTLYRVFKPYFKLGISAKFQGAAENFERFLENLLTHQPLELLDAPSTSLFLMIDQEVLAFMAKWRDKSNTYYDMETHSFLSQPESNALKKRREQEAALHFNTENDRKILKNPGQLSFDQTLDLWQWYQNKDSKFLVVQNAYHQFMTLITPQVHGSRVALFQLDPQVKAQCRTLYSLFQPYLIAAVPEERKQEVLQLDHYLVHLLSNKVTSATEAPLVQTFTDLDHYIQQFFRNTSTYEQHRSQTYYHLTQEKFAQELESYPLNPHIHERAHYVLQHTHYSKAIHEFRSSLFEITKLFNQTMRAQLTPNPIGVPFPEMEKEHQKLAQSKQVCALKDIFNSMYHLEGIVLELEKLNNKSTKSVYVYYLLQAYGHLNELIKLSQRLTKDPHLGFIAQELQDKAQALYATFQEQSDAYQVGPEQVPYGPSSVEHNALWYVLNAFYISPKHIRSLSNTTYLTTEELNELHIHAKRATLFIEELINSSDSYFKLFLQTPRMIYWYQELTKKLNEFTTTSHDAALNHLNEIRATVLTPMLIEADRWEDKLGFTPGALSGPLKQITDEFFKGFLHPLDLTAQTHISLVCDKKPVARRTTLVRNQMKNAEHYLKKIERDYHDIEDLYQCYLSYKTPMSFFRSAKQFEEDKEHLRVAYQKAIPKLARLKYDQKIKIEPSQYPDDHMLDAFCNAGLKAYDPHFTEIEALIQASHHYYLGLKATHQIRQDTAKEKLNYLTQLAVAQKEDDRLFVARYATESFDKHFEKLCARAIGLQYTDKEYQVQLKKYVLNFRNSIIAESKTAADINLKIQKRLKEKISLFEKRHYAEYYHLDLVRVSLAQFKNYFSESSIEIQKNQSLFESERTLNEKSQRINDLDAIAANSNLSIEARLDQIKNHVKDPNFTRIILNQKQTNTFSFNYLKICLLSLLEALHIYTPTRKKLLHNINSAIHHPPQINELTHRFGLFAATPPHTTQEGTEQTPRIPTHGLTTTATHA